MPKSRKRKRTKSQASASGRGNVNWGGGASSGGVSTKLILLGIAALVVIGGGYYIWQTAQASREFTTLAGAGTESLTWAQTLSYDGDRHLGPGEAYRYRNAYPTSGPHAPVPTRPGFYTSPQPPTGLVHALEHGGIVIYYGQAEAETIAKLKNWTSLYQGVWDGVVATPRSGLGNGVVLTAWRKRLQLASFDAKAAAAFIDAFRGRGPEKPVR
ncbi:MAG: DUF3105 domain-containing protein [Rhodospirillales bacterium]|jgi:hypothetical protein|nr:DUF3105 domain-containing protein [Rhodospirillales bacterium]MDP6643013.1 DUF3105 domain-containing protein [Rhodospirillales bacterium]|tara:strand:- start:428 stop:1066 length:639 start_codon:yes stop_codon:yes gene_type:complete